MAVALLFLAPAFGCAQSSAAIESIAPQDVAVLETLRVPLRVNDGNPSLGWGFVAPELPGFERTASISGNGTGGQFQWSPLASHVGTHEIEIQLLNGDSVVHARNLVVTVRPASDAAPIFISPGAGRTYDLERDPCVKFDVEVRDEDTPNVTIRTRGTLPEGAVLTTTGSKQAEFEWCPEPDQVGATERWTIALEADDMSHEPTALNFVIVLRSGTKDGCPGAAPTIDVLAPSEGARVENRGGYLVEARVDDDMGLRDAPLLYYSTAMPDDPTKPDITEFEQLPFSDGADGSFRARVPNLGLDEGEELVVFFLVSATDNDDPRGTLCDHRIDSPLVRFTALGGSSAGGLATCETCTSSSDCESGLCATAATGARCIPRCDGGESCAEGTCGSRTSVAGGIGQGCGPVSALCDGTGGGSGSCIDDGYEENDSIGAATASVPSFSDGQICTGDDDYYRITASTGTDVTVTVDGFIHSEGDLDLQLLSRTGTILASSAGVTNSESVSYCVPSADEVFARVEGFLGDENSYSMRVSTAPGTCCLDDAGEDDDTRATARVLSGTSFDGTVCPSDDDYVRFTVTEPTGVSVSIVFDNIAADLDLELYGPSGTVVGSSRGISDTETVDMDLFETGTYTARVYGFGTDFGDYLGEVRFTSFSGCLGSSECTSGEVCDEGACRSDACTGDTDCPTNHICPPPGPTAPVSHCGEMCGLNTECKVAESCKWFEAGRYCGARGAGGHGDACGTIGDCGGQRTCVAWPGGYCARVGCTSNADCGTGTYCVEEDGVNVCAVDCWSADEVCRLSAGYRCGVRTDLDTYAQFVCIPT
ncbi:MAG: PPC domain-containing protein [Deltaproteobacteria bacterium]|nr:PPC domain-containing protein [Deltaproteobacteria bacterium]